MFMHRHHLTLIIALLIALLACTREVPVEVVREVEVPVEVMKKVEPTPVVEVVEEVVEELEAIEELNLRELMLKEGLTVEEWRSALNKSTSEEVGLAFNELAIEGLEPAESWLLEEWSRHENLNREYSHGIVVDDSMSDELLNALFFLQVYLDLPPREQVDPDDLNVWCNRAVTPMLNYSEAPDQEKAPIIQENWERMEQHIFNCIDDPEHTSKHMLLSLYYDAQDWYEGMRMAPEIELALHRLDLMYAAREYRFTLTDITDECFDRYYGDSPSALRKCYATRLISDIPFLDGYQYDYVRSLME